jgi:hypothetical protein
VFNWLLRLCFDIRSISWERRTYDVNQRWQNASFVVFTCKANGASAFTLKMEAAGPPKFWSRFAKLRGVTSEKTIIFKCITILWTSRIGNPFQVTLPHIMRPACITTMHSNYEKQWQSTAHWLQMKTNAFRTVVLRTEWCRRNAVDMYHRGAGLVSQLAHCLSWSRLFVGFLSHLPPPPQQILGQYQDQATAVTFKFIIHESPYHSKLQS